MLNLDNLVDFPPIDFSDTLVGRKSFYGGYSTSFSLGCTLKKLMSAQCGMKLLDTSLNSNGDLLSANSSTTSRNVVDMHAISTLLMEYSVAANECGIMCGDCLS